MSSNRVATLIGLAALAGCSRVYHPEYHPETSFHYAQTIQNIYPTTVIVAAPPEPRFAASAPASAPSARSSPTYVAPAPLVSARDAHPTPSSAPTQANGVTTPVEAPKGTIDDAAREAPAKSARGSGWPTVQTQAFTTLWKTPTLAAGGITRARGGGALYGGNIAFLMNMGEGVFLKLAEVRYAASGGPEAPAGPTLGTLGSARMNLLELGILGASTSLRLGRSASLMFDIDWGAANTWTTVRSLTGDTMTARDWHGFWRGQVSACVGGNAASKGARKPMACATIAPNVHEWGWFNGVSLGLTAQM